MLIMCSSTFPLKVPYKLKYKILLLNAPEYKLNGRLMLAEIKLKLSFIIDCFVIFQFIQNRTNGCGGNSETYALCICSYGCVDANNLTI
jgi:hypothetical protein